MTTLTIQIPDKETELLTQIVKKLNGKVISSPAKADLEKSIYNPDAIAKVRKGEKDYEAGKGVKIAIADLWK
ncbi:hypothetical protein FW774_20010 [Pedobacter sp. BS3]|uniref:DUF2683 family protein n=1 Tax=Pedobacter sp. BS3 TaxID=2567937 RepID=UPI0011ED385E|nr:DUF2683 family protein [Pedobacter sp. BS3]TZF80915.1 hypothetical protein FW774_20010 [Pedobacter sp. BS3]